MARLSLSAAVAVGLLLVCVGSALATAPGDLDTTFNGTGIVKTLVGSGIDPSGRPVTVRESDGSFAIVAGVADASGNLAPEVAHYDSDGQPDTGFGTKGIATVPAHNGDVLVAPVMAYQPSTGDLIVAGTWESPLNVGVPADFGMVRLKPDGSLDTSFGKSGFVDTPPASDAAKDVFTGDVYALTVDPGSGEIFLGGDAQNDTTGSDVQMALAAFDANGNLENGSNGTASFGTGGSVLTPISGGTAQTFSLTLDGTSVVAAGSFTATGGGNGNAVVMRYTAAGAADSSFNKGAPVAVELDGGNYSGAYSVLIQSGHRIVIGGFGFYTSGSSTLGCQALARLSSDGTLDTTFGSHGVAHLCVGQNGSVFSIAAASDGQYLYAAGNTIDNASNEHVLLTRWSADGALDSGFGTGGEVISDPDGSTNPSEADGVVMDGANPVIGGHAADTSNSKTNAYFVLERLIGVAVTLTAPADNSVLNVGKPTFSGAAGTGSSQSSTVTVRIYSGSSVSGTTVQTLTATQSAGKWSVAPTTALADGTYTAQAEQDDSGADKYFSSPSTFTVDTTPPAVTLTSPGDKSTVSTGTPQFSGAAGTASGDFPGITVRISSVSGTPVTKLSTTESGGKWSVAPAGALADGTYTAQAEQDDAAGNKGLSSTATFTVKASSSGSGGSSGSPPTGSLEDTTDVTETTAMLHGIVYPNGSTVTGCDFSLTSSGGSYQTVPCSTAAFSGTGQVTVSGNVTGLTPGTHYSVLLQVATAAAGPNDLAGGDFTTLAPAAPIVTVSSPASVTNSSKPTISGTAADNPADSPTVTVRVYSGNAASGSPVQTLTTAESGGSWSVTPSSALSDGVYTVQAEQDDSFGNRGLSSPLTFTVMTAGPTVTLSSPGNDRMVSESEPFFAGVAGTAAADSPTVTVRVFSGHSTADSQLVQTLSATRQASGAWLVRGSAPLPDGIYTAQAEQADSAGNKGFSHTSVFAIDTVAPVVTITASNGSVVSTSKPTLSGLAGTAFGDLGSVTLRIFSGTDISGPLVESVQATVSSSHWTATASTALPDGTYIAQAEQDDAAGNVGLSKAVQITVSAGPPQIDSQAPPNLSAQNTSTDWFDVGQTTLASTGGWTGQVKYFELTWWSCETQPASGSHAGCTSLQHHYRVPDHFIYAGQYYSYEMGDKLVVTAQDAPLGFSEGEGYLVLEVVAIDESGHLSAPAYSKAYQAWRNGFDLDHRASHDPGITVITPYYPPATDPVVVDDRLSVGTGDAFGGGFDQAQYDWQRCTRSSTGAFTCHTFKTDVYQVKYHYYGGFDRATSDEYVLSPADAGYYIAVRVTLKDLNWSPADVTRSSLTAGYAPGTCVVTDVAKGCVADRLSYVGPVQGPKTAPTTSNPVTSPAPVTGSNGQTGGISSGILVPGGSGSGSGGAGSGSGSGNGSGSGSGSSNASAGTGILPQPPNGHSSGQGPGSGSSGAIHNCVPAEVEGIPFVWSPPDPQSGDPGGCQPLGAKELSSGLGPASGVTSLPVFGGTARAAGAAKHHHHPVKKSLHLLGAVVLKHLRPGVVYLTIKVGPQLRKALLPFAHHGVVRVRVLTWVISGKGRGAKSLSRVSIVTIHLLPTKHKHKHKHHHGSHGGGGKQPK